MNTTQVVCAIFVAVTLFMPLVSEGSNLKGERICNACKGLVEKIEKLIKLDVIVENEDLIIFGLEMQCTMTFEKYPKLATACVDLVNGTVRDIIDFLKDDLTPDQVCGLIHMCPKPTLAQLGNVIPQDSSMMALRREPVCNICKVTVNEIEELVGIGHMEDEIIGYLKQGCTDTFAKQPVIEETCMTLVDTFGQYVLDRLANGLEPEHICELIGAC